MIQSGNKRFYNTMKTHQVKLRFIMQCPFPHNGSINFFSTVEITDYSLKCLKLIESFPYLKGRVLEMDRDGLAAGSLPDYRKDPWLSQTKADST